MHLINLIVNYLYRKYGVLLHNFFENWTKGTSHLNKLVFCFTEEPNKQEAAAVKQEIKQEIKTEDKQNGTIKPPPEKKPKTIR